MHVQSLRNYLLFDLLPSQLPIDAHSLNYQKSEIRNIISKCSPRPFPPFSTLFASLLSGVVGTMLYRADGRSPKAIKEHGGFKQEGSNAEGTLFQHVEKPLHDVSRDPYVIVSTDIKVAKGYLNDKTAAPLLTNSYVYTLDSTKFGKSKVHDVAAEYSTLKPPKPYGHAAEKEFAVEYEIPWCTITAIIYRKGVLPTWCPSRSSPSARLHSLHKRVDGAGR
jgi:hypothetical protein